MITFRCLIIKSYHGTSVQKQRELVCTNGFELEPGHKVIWIKTVETVEEVKQVERAIRGKVPYIKERV